MKDPIPYEVGARKIARFVKRVNYGNPVEIVYGTPKDCLAQITHTRVLDLKDGSVTAINVHIDANEGLIYPPEFPNFEDTIKAVLMHEVGHLHTGYRRVGNRLVHKRGRSLEHDADTWAIKRAKQMGLKRVARRLLKMVDR